MSHRALHGLPRHAVGRPWPVGRAAAACSSPCSPAPPCSLGSTLSLTARTVCAWRAAAALSASPGSVATTPSPSARRTAPTWSRRWTPQTPAAMSPPAVRLRRQGAPGAPGGLLYMSTLCVPPTGQLGSLCLGPAGGWGSGSVHQGVGAGDGYARVWRPCRTPAPRGRLRGLHCLSPLSPECNASLCKETPPVCQLGFEVQSKMIPGRCCPFYSCGEWAGRAVRG